MTAPDLSAGTRREPAGNMATGWLKLIALVFMFVDHSGKVLCQNMLEMRLLGRIAFPIYLWCMVVGFCRTRSVPRYMLRVLLVGVVSQPLYVLALDYGQVSVVGRGVFKPFLELSGSGLAPVFSALLQVLRRLYVPKPNIFLTLFLGLGALWGIREKKYGSFIWAPLLAILLAGFLGADYGWKGIVLLILLYAVRDSRPGIAAVMIGFFLFWGSSYSQITSLFGVSLDMKDLPSWISAPVGAFLRLETFALLALPAILIRFPRDLKMPRWLGYALYPAHLVLLIILKVVFLGW